MIFLAIFFVKKCLNIIFEKNESTEIFLFSLFLVDNLLKKL